MKEDKTCQTKEWKAIKHLANTLMIIREDALMYKHCLNGNALYDKCDKALQTMKKILNDKEE